MNKEELLQELKLKVSVGEITKDELTSLIDIDLAEHTPKKKGIDINTIFYYIGAAVIILGIVFLVAQVWDDMQSLGRIMVTLGIGIIFAVTGSILLYNRSKDSIGSVFHIIGGVLIPSGIAVTFTELNLNINSLWPYTITFGALFASYVLLAKVHQRVVLTFISFIHGTIFTYMLVESLVGDPFSKHSSVFVYLTMIIGLVYLMSAYLFKDTYNKKIVGPLHLFGSLAFLGAGFNRVFDSGLWELSYFALPIAGIVWSTQVRSLAVLIVSTLFLVAHIIYITSEYFASSVGWPISLVILGFVLIGLGYTSVSIGRKFNKSSTI